MLSKVDVVQDILYGWYLDGFMVSGRCGVQCCTKMKDMVSERFISLRDVQEGS